MRSGGDLILVHKQMDTTGIYARLYDGTAAADYYRAMVQIESHLSLADEVPAAPPSHGELVALLDLLRGGTLNQTQVEALQILRSGILALAEQEADQRRPNGDWVTAEAAPKSTYPQEKASRVGLFPTLLVFYFLYADYCMDV